MAARSSGILMQVVSPGDNNGRKKRNTKQASDMQKGRKINVRMRLQGILQNQKVSSQTLPSIANMSYIEKCLKWRTESLW